MELNDPNSIYGVPPGILYGQYERLGELNDRIQNRQFPDSGLAPNYDPRPVSTKYALFPILDGHKQTHVPKNPYLDHFVEVNFSPATARGPPAGYQANLDTENMLRNQCFALQRGIGQNIFVPSSKSDLYNTRVPTGPYVEQPCPLLFETPQFDHRVHRNLAASRIGNETFNNNTRVQLGGTNV